MGKKNFNATTRAVTTPIPIATCVGVNMNLDEYSSS